MLTRIACWGTARRYLKLSLVSFEWSRWSGYSSTRSRHHLWGFCIGKQRCTQLVMHASDMGSLHVLCSCCWDSQGWAAESSLGSGFWSEVWGVRRYTQKVRSWWLSLGEKLKGLHKGADVRVWGPVGIWVTLALGKSKRSAHVWYTRKGIGQAVSQGVNRRLTRTHKWWLNVTVSERDENEGFNCGKIWDSDRVCPFVVGMGWLKENRGERHLWSRDGSAKKRERVHGLSARQSVSPEKCETWQSGAEHSRRRSRRERAR